MRFSPKKILWLFLSSVLILQLTSFGYATEDPGLSVNDLGLVKREFKKLSDLSLSIRSIKDKEHGENLSTISTQKWKHFSRKLEKERLKSEVSGWKFKDITLLDMLNLLEKPDADAQKNIDRAILQCAELTKDAKGKLAEFLAFTPKVFDVFKKWGPAQATSEFFSQAGLSLSIPSVSLLYFALDIRENGSLEFSPKEDHYSPSFYEEAGILKPSGINFDDESLKKIAELEPGINGWLYSFEKHYQDSSSENLLTLDELERFSDSISGDSILTLSTEDAKAEAIKFFELDTAYEKANQRFQALRVLRESINGLKEWVALQDIYFKEIINHKDGSKVISSWV